MSALDRTRSGQSLRASDSDSESVTEVAEREPPESDDSPDPEPAVAHLRERGERVARRELDTALARLAASGEVTPAERAAVARLADDLANTLIEEWASNLADAERTDIETALDLLLER
ncbi:hypothetical protein [Halorussus amylolyticus]|uniref:hypothetical protein n=1 Tax=Halorussus amylolyticus TaxID=1126242 RepID=UPI00104F1F44|nr:hypothetical protein [Halorussus amylolyticus]